MPVRLSPQRRDARHEVFVQHPHEAAGFLVAASNLVSQGGHLLPHGGKFVLRLTAKLHKLLLQTGDPPVEGDDAAVEHDDPFIEGKDAAVKGDDTRIESDDAFIKRDDTGIEGDDTAVKRDHARIEGNDAFIKGDDAAVKNDDARIESGNLSR